MIKVLILFLVLINVLTFLIYCLDRFTWTRNKNKNHYKEYSWLVLVLIGGSIGAWIGMKLWPPKNLTHFFKYSVPIVFIIQILTLIYFRYHM